MPQKIYNNALSVKYAIKQNKGVLQLVCPGVFYSHYKAFILRWSACACHILSASSGSSRLSSHLPVKPKQAWVTSSEVGKNTSELTDLCLSCFLALQQQIPSCSRKQLLEEELFNVRDTCRVSRENAVIWFKFSWRGYCHMLSIPRLQRNSMHTACRYMAACTYACTHILYIYIHGSSLCQIQTQLSW